MTKLSLGCVSLHPKHTISEETIYQSESLHGTYIGRIARSRSTDTWNMSRKRTIDAFFGAPKSKKPRPVDGPSAEVEDEGQGASEHPAYPFPIPHVPAPVAAEMASLPSSVGRAINDQPDLDLLYFEPYVPRGTERILFEFLRSQLPFYRVEYDINRGGVSTHIRTPRWTTVFGLDDTSRFCPEGGVVDAQTGKAVQTKQAPRPIPKCLDDLRLSAQRATGCEFNFCLVNYYAGGSDSISFHSDDERFLGPLPAIASFSLGARRDFLLKHKPSQPPQTGQPALPKDATKPLKLPLASGDMILMRGTTQANWLHSIPKRTGKNNEDGGRINVTFRRAVVKAGTDNYYTYNVGSGPVFKWDPVNREMRPWKEAL